MSIDVEHARRIAVEALEGQTKKGGGPVIEHVRRVADAVSAEDEKTVAWLHDVVERAPDWPLERLRHEGFSEPVIAAVDAMTKREGEPRRDFVRRAAGNPLALPVKRADLRDNLAAAERSGRDPEPYRDGLRILSEEFDA